MAANWHPAVAAAQGREEKLLRPHLVARLLGVTPGQVRRLWRQGKLRGEKITERKLLIPESAVREYQDGINQE